jgi:hypothetical protein
MPARHALWTRITSTLLAIVLLGQTAPAFAIENGGGQCRWLRCASYYGGECIDWCGADTALYPGGWVPYGDGTGRTEAEASQLAYDLMDAACGGAFQVANPSHAISALGSATIDPNLVTSAFGSSGNDGLHAELGTNWSATQWTAGWSTLTATVVSADSAFVSVNPLGSVAGVAHDLGSVTVTTAGSGTYKVGANFGPTGASSAYVRCFLGGALRASGFYTPAQGAGLISSGAGWPHGTSVLAHRDTIEAALAWTSPVSYRLPGDASPTLCDSVVLMAHGATLVTGGLAGANVRLKNMQSLFITGLEYTGAPLSGQSVPAVSPLSLMAMAALLLLILWAGLSGKRRLAFGRRRDHSIDLG